MSSTATENINNVMIVAGESSGDLHGSNLIKAAAEHYPHLRFFGVGGDRMCAAGCRILFPSDELSVMGVVEVLSQFPKIYSRFKQLKQVLKGADRPALLVLIDFPDFNLRLAKVAKAVGVPVLYYISPKVWAWRKGRAKTIAERVDRLALIFPFEPKIYKKLGVQAEYVGNPLLDEFVENQPQGLLRHRLGIAGDTQVVGIFPGSRNSELNYILETLVATADLLSHAKPGIKFLVPVAPSLSREFIQQRFSKTQLLALSGTPMAILYKVAPLSYAIGKRLIKIEYAGLTNIVAGRGIVREFIQDDAQPEKMCEEMLRLLDDDVYRQRIRDDLAEVCQRLGDAGCSERVAEIVHEMCLEGNMG